MFCSCEKKENIDDLKFLLTKRWFQVSPKKILINVGGEIPHYRICPDTICAFTPTIEISDSGNYLRQNYYNVVPQSYWGDYQYVKMTGLWELKNNTIFLSPATVLQIDQININIDSLRYVWYKGFMVRKKWIVYSEDLTWTKNG